MTKIEELRVEAKNHLEKATSKEQIDEATKLLNMIDDVEAESNSLAGENAKLVNAYKELIREKSFAPTTPQGKTEKPSFEEALKAFNKKKGNN